MYIDNKAFHVQPNNNKVETKAKLLWNQYSLQDHSKEKGGLFKNSSS